MSNKRLLEQFKAELRQAMQDFKDGKGIPLEEFDWGRPSPLYIAEAPGNNYHVAET